MTKLYSSYRDVFVAMFLGCLLNGQIFAESELMLRVSNGSEAGLFSVEGDITYSAAEKAVQMAITMGGDDSNNPLFCFDFSDAPTASVTVNSQSSELESGVRLLLDSLHLSDSVNLKFDVSTATLELVVPNSSSELACFLRPLNSQEERVSFDLLGATKGVGGIFADRFEAPVQRPNLVVSLGEPSLEPTGHVQYTITIKNDGNIGTENVAMQQSIPHGLDVVVNSCTIPGDDCSKYEKDVLRYEGFALAPEAQMVIGVTASRNSSWPTGGTKLPVYLAAVAVGAGAIWHDVADAELSPTSQ